MVMTSKERVLTTFASQEPDRVPINYSANDAIDRRLKEHFGLEADDAEGLLQALGVDAGSNTRPVATGISATSHCKTLAKSK